MNKDRFLEVIGRREYVEKISCGEWAEEIERCQKQLTDILVEDIDSTINFLQTECKANEYLWISEVLEDVVEKAPSEKLVQSFKDLMGKFPEECAIYDIEGSIQGAEAILKWEAEHGKKD